MRSPFRKASLLNHLFNFHQLPTSTSPPSRTAPSSNTSRPRFPSPLQRSLWPPEDVPDCRRIGGCPDAQGPVDLLAPSGPCERAPPPAGWVVDGWQQGGFLCRGEMGLVLWSATGERQCVGGDAVWHIDCSNTKTCKSENLICIGWDGGNHEARVKAFVGPRAIWHTWWMHQPKLYMHSHFLQNNVDLPLHKNLHVLLLWSNNPAKQVKSNQSLDSGEKFLNCSSETGKARKLTRALVLANRELPSPSTLPQPLCTPTTSAPPPPTCPVCTRDWPSG